MQPVNREPIELDELISLPGVEERSTLAGRVGFLAIHGGNLERVTDKIAQGAAEASGASFYGVIQPKGLRRHMPATKFDPDRSAALAEFIDHCDVVISLHGYGKWGRWTDLLVGGQHRALASHVSHHVRRELPQYNVVEDVEAIPSGLRGLHPRNPCNLTTGGGIQIELPPRVRGLTPMALHWPGHERGETFSHVHRLIDGLAAAARRWPAAD